MKTKITHWISILIIIGSLLALISCKLAPDSTVRDETSVIIGIECETDTIVIDTANGYGQIPSIYAIRQRYVNGVATDIYKDTNFLSGRQVTILETDKVTYSNSGLLYVKDSTQHDWTDTVQLYLIQNGQIDYNIGLQLIVQEHRIEAETLDLHPSWDTPLEADGKISLRVDYYPSNTSYLETDFIIQHVIKDGQKITENLTEYAQIGEVNNNWAVLSISNLQAGDKVSVIARSKRDEDIISNALEIPVV